MAEKDALVRRVSDCTTSLGVWLADRQVSACAHGTACLRIFDCTITRQTGLPRLRKVYTHDRNEVIQLSLLWFAICVECFANRLRPNIIAGNGKRCLRAGIEMECFNERAAMNYLQWRSEVFGQPETVAVQDVELSEEAYALPLETAFDYLDRVLTDEEIHALYSERQLAMGLSIAYSNCWSDFPFCYLHAGTEDRRVAGILNLKNLYRNFFARYSPHIFRQAVNHQQLPEYSIEYVCFNFWDRFVLFPGGPVKESMVNAGLDVMEYSLQLENETCIVSGLEAISFWSYACREMNIDRPLSILQQWNSNPTSPNADVIEIGRRTLEYALS